MKLVLFDLDDTLIQGDSAKLWLKFCVEKGFLPQEYLEKIVFYQKQYQEKKLDMDEFMTFFLQSVKGCPSVPLLPPVLQGLVGFPATAELRVG